MYLLFNCRSYFRIFHLNTVWYQVNGLCNCIDNKIKNLNEQIIINEKVQQVPCVLIQKYIFEQYNTVILKRKSIELV